VSDQPTQALLPGRQGMLVRLQAETGQRPGLLDVVHRYTDGLGAEPGTEIFIVHVDPDDEDIVWLYEVFRDDQALVDHRSTSGFAMLMEELPEYLASPPGVLRMDPMRMSVQQGALEEDLSL
jgi:autoinducer 2-degrading protein